jgi:hypothetical protein
MTVYTLVGYAAVTAVLLARCARNELGAVTGVLSKNANGLFGDKTSGNKSDAEQIPYPLGIFRVVLVAFYGPDPFGIGDRDAYGIFKEIVNGDPILPGRFHADVKA